MAPRLAGVLHGIGDACYSAGGFVVPLMINAMITDDPYLIRSGLYGFDFKQLVSESSHTSRHLSDRKHELSK